MPYDKEMHAQAKRDKQALVTIEIDRRYCEPSPNHTQGKFRIEGPVSAEQAEAALALLARIAEDE